jgi:CheY-like chemotaxis protein
MSDTVAIEAVKTVPGVLWVAFALLVYLTLRRTMLPQLSRLSTVKTPMFEVSFAEQLLNEAAAKVQAGPKPSASDGRAAASRLEHAAEILKGGRILWVDDNPDWNEPLIRLFRELAMTVDTARSTDEALGNLRSRSYDLVISDMHRDTEQPSDRAGLTLIDALARQGTRLPVIIYAASFDPRRGVHPAIFACTDGVNSLVHYVIDLMERVKFGTAF